MSNYALSCHSCQATLKYNDALIGQTLSCPRCKTAVTLPAPGDLTEDDEIITPVDVIEEETVSLANETQGSAIAKPLKKKKKKKKPAKKAGWEMPAIALEPIVWQGLFAILGIGLVIFAIYYLTRWPDAQAYEADLWRPHEVAPYLKVLLPGTVKNETQQVPGLSIRMSSTQPNKDAIFGVAYSDGRMAPGRLQVGSETILNDTCSGYAAFLENMGAVEESRQPIKHKDWPGKQLTMRVSEKKGYFLVRTYLVGTRLYFAIAGGRGLHEKHPDVVKFYDSFEITEVPDKPAEPQQQPPVNKDENPTSSPERKKEPPASNEKSDKAIPAEKTPPAKAPVQELISDQEVPPRLPMEPRPQFDVEPAIKPGMSTIYLSDMKEFGVSMAPPQWSFGKKGQLKSPSNDSILVNSKKYEQALSTHPGIDSRFCVYYLLGEKATRLNGSVGINDTGNSSEGRFAIVGDGKTLWTSRNKSQKGKIEPFNVDVTGVKVLSLQCWSAGSNHGCHCVWLDPVLTLKPGKK